MASHNVIPFSEMPRSDVSNSLNHTGSGDQFVTKLEFNAAIIKLEHKIDEHHTETQNAVQSVEEHFNKVDDHFDFATENNNHRFNELAESLKSINYKFNWLIGILITSILIPIALKLFFN
jgi:hypothetical protein